MSTGLTEGTDAAAAWGVTDQRTWHCRCPQCGGLFEPKFAHYDKDGQIVAGLLYDRKFLPNGTADAKAIAASLRYRCPLCPAEFPDTQGSRTRFSGTWDAPTGAYVALNPNAAPKRFGWTMHNIAIRPWLPIVLRFETALMAKQRGDYEKLAEWIREECAGIWNPGKEMSAQKKRPIGEYNMGDEWPEEIKDPEGRPWRFATVDVQLDHYVLVIRAWGPFSKSRLVWAEKVTTPGYVDDICKRFHVPTERTFLDARHSTDRVRRLCGLKGWRSFMGEGTEGGHRVKDYAHLAMGGIRRIYSEPLAIDPWQGTTEQGKGIIFETKFSKTSGLDRWHNLRTLEANDGTPLWTAAKNAPEFYWREIEAFYRVSKKSDAGQMFYVWEVSGPDHAADCETMGIVAASMGGLVGSEAIESATEEPASA
jgi:hypothetical protein